MATQPPQQPPAYPPPGQPPPQPPGYPPQQPGYGGPPGIPPRRGLGGGAIAAIVGVVVALAAAAVIFLLLRRGPEEQLAADPGPPPVETVTPEPETSPEPETTPEPPPEDPTTAPQIADRLIGQVGQFRLVSVQNDPNGLSAGATEAVIAEYNRRDGTRIVHELWGFPTPGQATDVRAQLIQRLQNAGFVRVGEFRRGPIRAVALQGGGREAVIWSNQEVFATLLGPFDLTRAFFLAIPY